MNNKREQEQLKAVKQDGLAIQYITNPREAVQLEAVKQDGLAIQYITNPSDTVSNTAIDLVIEQLYTTKQGLCSLLGVKEIKLFSNGNSYYWGDPEYQTDTALKESRECRHNALELIRCMLLDKLTIN